MKKFKVKDTSSGQLYAEIECPIIPQIGSLIKISDETFNDSYYIVRDIMYTFYEGSNDFDCDLFVKYKSK